MDNSRLWLITFLIGIIGLGLILFEDQ